MTASGALQQRYVAADLVLPYVLIRICGFHLQEREVELIPGKQALAQAVPVSELDEIRFRQSPLVTERPLRFLAAPDCQLVAREIGCRQRASHKGPDW